MRNQFSGSASHDHVIVDGEGKMIGTLRVKPSGILWKPRNSQVYYRISLDEFAELAKKKGEKVKR